MSTSSFEMSSDIQATYDEKSNGKLSTISLDEDLEKKPRSEEIEIDDEKNKSSIGGAIFNLSNCAIGGSMLLLPINLLDMGYVFGVFVILLAAAASSFTLYYIGRIMSFTRVKTYSALASKSFGKKGEIATVVVFLMLLLAPMLIYHVVIGKNLVNIYEVGNNFREETTFNQSLDQGRARHWYETHSFYSGLVATCIIFPLSLIDDMSKISKFSIICLIAIAYFVMLIVVENLMSIGGGDLSRFDDLKPFNFDKNLKFLSAFGNIIMSFCTQTSIVDIFGSIRHSTVRRQSIVNLVSNGIVAFVYLLVGISGLLLYGSKSMPENALLQKDKIGIEYLIGRVLFAIMMALSYPFLLIPARNSADWILKEIGKSAKGFGASYANLGDKTKRIILSLFFIFVPYGVTIGVSSLGFFAGFFGSTAGACISFIFPSAFFLRLSRKNPKFGIKTWEKVSAYSIIFLGVIIFFVCGAYEIYAVTQKK